MIQSFKHKGLKLLCEEGKGNKLPPSQLVKIKRILEIIHHLEVVPDDLEFFQSLRPHPLKGNLKGYWSLDVTGNYRIIFRFDPPDAYDLDYLDTH